MMPPAPDTKEIRSMPVEHAAEHPTFQLGSNKITSLAAPSRGADEVAMFTADLPPGGGLPPHHHDHLDVFVFTAGGGLVHIGDDVFTLATGDSAVVPAGAVHYVEAGAEGASILVAMLGGTKLFREDDGSVTVPPWVG
jgi:quercetin dioxygenase-like cupin family protein